MAIRNHSNKIILGVVALWALLFLGACTKEQAEQNSIGFGIAESSGWSAATRVGELTTTTLATSGFGVFAYYTESSTWESAPEVTPDFMNNTRVTSTNNGASWNYSPRKYWQHTIDDKVTFFAYAPYMASQQVDGSQIDYTVPQDVADQVDLTWSTTSTKNLNRESGTVHFAFQHALARIGFTAIAKSNGTSPLKEGVTVRIKRVEVGYSSEAINTNGFYTSGTLELDNTKDVALWSNCTGSVSYVLGPANYVGQNPLGFELTQSNTASAQQLNRNEDYIMVIPQDFSVKGFDVFVEYEVELSSKDKVGDGYHVYHSYTNRCVASVKLDLEAAKTYIINITTDLENASIDDISITEWVSGGEVLIQGIVPEIVGG